MAETISLSGILEYSLTKYAENVQISVLELQLDVTFHYDMGE